MILFVIAQEPLYRMFKSKLNRTASELPNNFQISLVGFVDDTTIIVKSEESIKESLVIIEDYEEATGAMLNYEKTIITGIGLWKNRNIWPVSNMKSVEGSFKILGVIHDNDYEKAREENWKRIEKSIVSQVGQLYSR